MPRARRPRPDAPKPMLGVKGPAHPRSKFGAEQRAQAVELYVLEGLSASAIARRLGCHRFSVKRWIDEAGAGAAEKGESA